MTRIFDSGDQARDAGEKLLAAGFGTDTTFVMAPVSTPSVGGTETMDPEESDTPAPAPAAPVRLSAEELVEKVRPAGDLDIIRAMVCSRALENGQALVVVGAHHGSGLRAQSIMDSCGALSADLLDVPRPDNPSPFSDFFGLPCLEDRLSFLSSDNPLKDPHWTLFPVQLKNKLTFNIKLIDNPAWLSSKVGMKTLTEDKPWRTSFGFKLLANQQD
ncbi:MAG: hypothetical protein RIC38_03065 [Chromatocurvus sp.]